MNSTEALGAADAPIAHAAAIRAVCDHDGKRWRVEGAGWTMQPEGRVSLGEAEAICRAVERALAVPPAGPLAQFFDETFVAAPEYFVLTHAAHRAYLQWCRSGARSNVGLQAFMRYATDRFGRVQSGADFALKGVRFRSREDDITPEAVATLRASADAAPPKAEREATWDEGVDFALTQLCAMLDVDPAKVSWDAATETAEGDVRSVIGNILRAWAADDWQDLPAIREMLLAGQGDDDGSQILPDFQEDMTAHAMVAACVHLLERRRDALDGYAIAKLAPPPRHPELEALRDLAHVLDAQIEEGAILPDGMGLVIAALARVYPDRVHTGARCQVPECLVHGPCDECPTEVQWARLEGLLTTWLAEHPREGEAAKAPARPQAPGRDLEDDGA